MDDKTGISWSDPGWPYGDLNRSTALLYFELSPFFDSNSNNADARARGLDPANEHVLRSMPIERPEYVITEAQDPHMFVVRRQARQRDGTMQHQAYYYILYMTIYQAPTLHSVITSRLRRCMFSVRQGLECIHRDLAPLPKLLLEQERKASQAGAAAGPADAAQIAGTAGAAAAAAAASVADVQPVVVPEVLSVEEQDYWERSDNIIMRTLQRYPMPQLPGLPEQQQPQQQQGAAFTGTAPKVEPQQPPTTAQPATTAPVPTASAEAPLSAGQTADAGKAQYAAAKSAKTSGLQAQAGASGRAASAVMASRAATPPPAPQPPAVTAATAAAAVSGAAGRAAPATSQADSGAGGGDSGSMQQGTTISGSTAAGGHRAGGMKVRLKVKPFGGAAAAPGAPGSGGSQGVPPPGEQPAAKRAKR